MQWHGEQVVSAPATQAMQLHHLRIWNGLLNSHGRPRHFTCHTHLSIETYIYIDRSNRQWSRSQLRIQFAGQQAEHAHILNTRLVNGCGTRRRALCPVSDTLQSGASSKGRKSPPHPKLESIGMPYHPTKHWAKKLQLARNPPNRHMNKLALAQWLCARRDGTCRARWVMYQDCGWRRLWNSTDDTALGDGGVLFWDLHQGLHSKPLQNAHAVLVLQRQKRTGRYHRTQRSGLRIDRTDSANTASIFSVDQFCFWALAKISVKQQNWKLSHSRVGLQHGIRTSVHKLPI